MTAVASLTRVRVVVDHIMPILLQRSTKSMIRWSVSLAHQDFIFCQNILSKRFFLRIFSLTSI